MNCPVCDRDLVATLSICPSCGAMMNDSVREELALKITPSGNLNRSIPLPSEPLPAPPAMKKQNPFAVPPPAVRHSATAELAVAKTSQTLVEFQPSATAVPEWRLQMQNAVRARRGTEVGTATAVAPAPALLRTNGSAALKAQPVEQFIPENSDPRLGNALKRIAQSRDSFKAAEPERKAFPPREPVAERQYPFEVVEPVAFSPEMPRVERKATVNQPPRPSLVTSTPAIPPITLKRDTNKLPKIAEIIPETIVETEIEPEVKEVRKRFEFENIKRIFIPAEKPEIEAEIEEEFDEIEDLAPIGTRFGAGLFDFVIGTAVSLAILSPFAITASDWATMSGLLILCITTAAVLFTYLTLSVGLYGRSIGMRIFSIETVDAEKNVYPTIKQAAINSAVYLASTPFVGAGFLTVFFNEENRAAHDIAAGTIVVREF